VKTHFCPGVAPDDIEQAPCGTLLGEDSQLSGDWANVDCRLCQKRKANITKSAEAEESAIIEQMGEMAKFMRADLEIKP
jgi:hypothetical protein